MYAFIIIVPHIKHTQHNYHNWLTKHII